MDPFSRCAFVSSSILCVGRALQADTDDEDPECDDASTDTGRGFNPTDTGNDASTDPTPKPEPKRQRTDTSAELCRPNMRKQTHTPHIDTFRSHCNSSRYWSLECLRLLSLHGGGVGVVV